MTPDTHRRIPLLILSDGGDHWADELPLNFTLEAADLIDIPYTFERNSVLQEASC